ncbi:MAG: arginine deiminase family protein [Candidatus Bathyarchaeota archaeon]|nr:arginine deiminase family protein [Candidatus Bathyarchaeota archaeon]
MEYGAQTEYGRLRKVLMHRPTEELKRITPGNKDAYLFRDVVYWKEFQREHDAFTDILRGEGVEVHLVGDLLDEGDRLVAERLPNLVYTRDAISINGLGAMVLRMTYQPRYPEPLLAGKAVKRLGVPIALRVAPPGMVEGGDFVYLDEETVMMGFGTRSNEAGVDMVRERILGKAVREFVAVPLPSFRVHLDGALMVMAPDLALFHRASLGLFPSYVFDEDGVRLQFLEDYLGEKGVELVYADDTEVRMFGTNIVGLGGGKCISYEWNERIMSILGDRGFDVIGIPGSQLSIGGGGPHCMTAPVLRED